MLDRIQLWVESRKDTVPAHWLLGILCGLTAIAFFPAGLVLLGIFAAWEYWNDKNHNTHQGDVDWLDTFLTFCITIAVTMPFNLAGLINIRWY